MMTHPHEPETALPENAQEPAFWNAEVESIPWCRELKQRYPEILMELNELVLMQRPFQAFPDYGLYSQGWEAFPVSRYEGEFNEYVPGTERLDMALMAQQFEQHGEFGAGQCQLLFTEPGAPRRRRRCRRWVAFAPLRALRANGAGRRRTAPSPDTRQDRTARARKLRRRGLR